MNKVILMGRLTSAPEVKQTPSGISVTRFTIAVNRRFAKDGEQNVDFISCVAWRETGERIARYFGKGSMIAVVGSIQVSSWETQSGKRYRTEVIIDEWDFTGEKRETAGTSAPDDDFEPITDSNFSGFPF